MCLWNVQYMNNYIQLHSALTIIATACIFAYRIASQSLESPFSSIKTWDTVIIVNVFWGILIAQFVFEILTYIGTFKMCAGSTIKFAYSKPKAKTEDCYCDNIEDRSEDIDDVKLKLACSLSHIMYNDMMLIIILLMRPHNVVMVPSLFFTCKLTAKCLDHKLLDSRPGRTTDAADTLSRTLVHLWIGALFYFYQVIFFYCNRLSFPLL